MYLAATTGHKVSHIETLGRKDGVTYLYGFFAGRNDMLLSTLNTIRRPAILISVGRSLEILESIDNDWFKTIIRIDAKRITGLERWSEETGTFFYVATSIERAIDLAINLAERGDVVFFAPKSYKQTKTGFYARFNQKIAALLA